MTIVIHTRNENNDYKLMYKRMYSISCIWVCFFNILIRISGTIFTWNHRPSCCTALKCISLLYDRHGILCYLHERGEVYSLSHRSSSHQMHFSRRPAAIVYVQKLYTNLDETQYSFRQVPRMAAGLIVIETNVYFVRTWTYCSQYASTVRTIYKNEIIVNTAFQLQI